MTAETHIISKVPLDSMPWVSRKNMTRQCGISVRPVDTISGLEVHSHALYGSLFDSIGGSTVSDTEIPSDGSRKLFLVLEDQTDSVLEDLMRSHRRPSEVVKVELDIPYSVVTGEATVTSVKLYAASADGVDVTDKLTSKHHLSSTGYTIPSEVEVSNDEDSLIATCDLSKLGVATGDITEFVKTTNYPTMTLNITAVVEVEGTVATWTGPSLGSSVRILTQPSQVIAHTVRDEEPAEFTQGGVQVSVDLATGQAKANVGDTDTGPLVEKKSSHTSDIEIDGVTYTISYEIRNKLWHGQDPVHFTSVVTDDDPPVAINISPEGEFNLLNPVADPDVSVAPFSQPILTVRMDQADIARVTVHNDSYDPATSDMYHKLEYNPATSDRNRGSALLRDADGKPVFVAITPKENPINTSATIDRLYIVDDSQYTDQYGTESMTIHIQQ